MTPALRDLFYQAYRAAKLFSDDLNTANGAVLTDEKLQASRVTAANRFPAGVHVTPERLQSPAKYEYMVHAEQAAILTAGRRGICTDGLVLVCPWASCANKCAQDIIEAGITAVYTHKQCHDRTPERWQATIDTAVQMFAEAGVQYYRVDGEIGEIEHRFNGEIWNP